MLVSTVNRMQLTGLKTFRGNGGAYKMVRISYNKLWKMLIDKEMQKRDLQKAAGISSASIAKLGKNENITTDILLRICDALNCDLNDIVETRRSQAT